MEDYNYKLHPSSMEKHQDITMGRVKYFINSGDWNKVNIHSALWKKEASGNGVVDLTSWSAPNLDRPTFAHATSQNFNVSQVGDEFGPSWSTHWFKVRVTIPQDFHGEKVEFIFDPNCEAMVWTLSGSPMRGITGGDGVTQRIDYLLTESAVAGEVHEFYVETACNGLKGNAIGSQINPPKEDRYFTLRKAAIAVKRQEAWQLMYDTRIIVDMAIFLGNNNARGLSALHTANQIVNIFDHENPDETIAQARKVSKAFLEQESSSATHQITTIGNCHIDTAWMWTYDETRRKVARSFATQLNLLERYPDYKFTASQAQQFEWLEKDYPDLFARVQDAVKTGRFIIIGGTWIEMDCNLPNGESLVRQFIFGQRYFAEKFGVRTKVFWLPDTFGYSSQIPQIVRQSGAKYFFTQKLSWNTLNKFPHTSFDWYGLDGSSIIAHMAPALTYNGVATVAEVAGSVKNHRDITSSNSSLYLYGYGDGGGGPNEVMIESLARMANTDGMPKIKHRDPVEFYDELEQVSGSLPKWSGELYFEFHRGTYTSMGKNKKLNRQTENLLHSTELFATLAAASSNSSQYSYPRDELIEAWKVTLTNQFHDVIPGCSIQDVYKDTDILYTNLVHTINGIRQNAVSSLLGDSTNSGKFESEQESSTEDRENIMSAFDYQIPTLKSASANSGEESLFAMNALAWPREEIVQVPGLNSSHSQVVQVLNKRTSLSTRGYSDVAKPEPVPVVLASNIGDLSISKVESSNASAYKPTQVYAANGNYVLENAKIRATFDTRGRLVSLIDLEAARELVPEGKTGNNFVIYPDVPLLWDAWDVEIYHLEKSRHCQCTSIEIADQGPFVSSLCIDIKVSEVSTIRQWVSLSSTSSTLEFSCEADWHEAHKILKVEFCWDIKSEFASFETQFGYIRRPTHRSTSWDLAKFEVCAHKYVDFSEFGYGVAMFNDSKYGHSVCDNTMTISLLRSPKSPNPVCDMGFHSFRFGVHPHSSSFPDTRVIKEASNFSAPLEIISADPSALGSQSFVNQNLGSSPFTIKNGESVILDTIKFAELPLQVNKDIVISSVDPTEVPDSANSSIKAINTSDISENLSTRNNCIVLRLFEAVGGRSNIELSTILNVKSVFRCDALENINYEYVKSESSNSYSIQVKPFEIVTLLLELN
ncbi:Alpha-mannosidase [Smittium culicis]|uniref:Alpha-mannosidase n=1 Tax=Smittium culicis TaxID=133412 RepID=A0A1R1Y1P4_9FUNG|nr:Alpha-mannosidase [Smittium culicis]